MSMFHPPFERLTEFADGQLNATNQAAVQRHVDGCQRCSSAVRWLQRALVAMRADDTEPVPEHVISRLLPIFDRRLRRSEPEPVGLTRRLVGILRFDSGTNLVPAFGLRADQQGPRQLLFEAEPYEIDVRAEPLGQEWTVSGQLLGPDEATTGEVELLGGDSTIQSPLNDMLEFRLPPVPSGAYTLDLRLSGGTVIQIAPLRLGG
jgi:anti-sigma factor RsiW